MPEQRLQRCRDAYAEPEWREFKEHGIPLEFRWHPERLASAAYRITQAQLAAERADK
jgi:hypothetical protein